MAAHRAGEAHEAARTLGVARLELAGLHEGAWRLEEGVDVIQHILRAWRPAVVYAPSCVDYHSEHLRVARACAAAIAELSDWGLVVRVYETFVPLGSGLVNRVADISAVEGRKAAAIACYTSQQQGLAQVRRRDVYLARFYRTGRAAEAFRELSSNAYVAFVEAGSSPDHRAPFRGLRGRPLTDPLAYLVGRAARRRLQRLPQG
jgi:LmbE family N-acetylglucosaminyl deacetylase